MSRYSDTILADSPVRYWRCNDAAGAGTVSETIVGDNAPIVNATYWKFVDDSVRPFGGEGAAHLLGSGGYATPASGPNAQLGQSYEFWYRPEVMGPGRQVFFRKSPNSNSLFTLQMTAAGKLEPFWRVSGTWYRIRTADVINVNNPYHISVTISTTGTIVVYVNGQSVTTQTNTDTTIVSTDNSFRLAAGVFGALPLKGYLSDFAIYDYELSAAQVAYHYNVGINAFVDFDPPTVTYPNGGEEIYDRSLSITWHNTEQTVASGDPAWHEIFFTENYKDNKRNDWLQIAQVPSATSSFTWVVPKNIKGTKCRIGIRSRNGEGYRSRMSVSAADFTFGVKKISAPSLMSPLNGDVYKMFVPIVFNDEGIKGTTSQRARYEIMYSSESNDIDWSPVEFDVETTTNPVYWDIRDLPAGNDYILRIRSVDQDGNSSRTIFVRDLNLTPSPVSQFIIDTLPPKGSISISSNIGYTNSRNVVLNLSAFDESTGVKSVQIRERMFNDSGELETKAIGPEQDFSNVKTWFLTNEDGLKFVEALYRDYGDNRISDDDSSSSFRDWLEESNNKVSALFINSFSDGTFNVWSAFFDGSSSNVYKDQDFKETHSGEVTAIEKYVDNIYFGIKGNNGKGSLARYGDTSFSHAFAENDSSISALQSYGSKLYMGVDHGAVYVFNGTTVTAVSVPFSGRVNSMFSDGKFLYMFVDHDDDIYIYNGTAFTTASVVDGSKQI